ncbi:MAG: multidrug effflux MFS transporter [SAR324 cluster bacterium]|nr:multidrug effflux MFS transporter [SAR324 cluster bacterium]
MAMMTALAALSIDAMLPALPQIGSDLGVVQENSIQLIVSTLLFGLGLGQMFFGPLSDSIGRKPSIYAGFLLFMIGCLIAILATDFSVMLIGRFLQGLGVSGPRVVSVALIRDQYKGRDMARVMSLVMGVFILVPAIAPSLGQGVLFIASWRAIFGLFLSLALITFIWFSFRQPETLVPDKRLKFSLKRIANAIREVCTNRISLGYTLATAMIHGPFIGYLNSAQQIFQDTYGLGHLFPLFFSTLALCIGSAFYTNSRLVMKYGMLRLSHWAINAVTGLSLIFVILAYFENGHLSLWVFMVYCMITFFCLGILFGNFNALAMEPLGHIAGIGAAVVGSLSTFISVSMGVMIGLLYDQTVLPLITGFAVLSAFSMFFMHWAEKSK